MKQGNGGFFKYDEPLSLSEKRLMEGLLTQMFKTVEIRSLITRLIGRLRHVSALNMMKPWDF